MQYSVDFWYFVEWGGVGEEQGDCNWPKVAVIFKKKLNSQIHR